MALDDVAGGANELRRAVELEHIRRHMTQTRKPALRAPTHLSRRGIEGQDPRCFPRNLPADLHILRAVAVKWHDQQIVMENRRGSQTMLTVEIDVALRPDNVALEVECGEAGVVEDGVDTFAVGDRRGSCERVLLPFLSDLLAEDFAGSKASCRTSGLRKAHGTKSRLRSPS